MESILKVSDLTVRFNGHTILDKVTFDVKRDSTLAIIGPNGAGKSVLFKSILGLLQHEGGVTWAGDVKIGYVPQKLSLANDLPLTVYEFLKFKENKRDVILKTLESVGFLKTSTHEHNDARVLNTKLGALSGGELQRVLIAYALLGNPNVLLFDEPTAGVDVSGEETVYSLIHKLQKDEDLTIIFISHELQVVHHYADTVLCLNKEQICYGPPLDVIDRKSLKKMYGEKVMVYKHQDHHH